MWPAAYASRERASITTMSESPALRSTDKSHESVWKRSLSSMIAAASPGAGAPYSRTVEISGAMIDSFSRAPLIFDHPSLSLNLSGPPGNPIDDEALCVIIVRLSRWSEAERSPANIKSPPLRGGIVRAVRIASPPRDQYILSAAVRSVQATNDFEAIGITM